MNEQEKKMTKKEKDHIYYLKNKNEIKERTNKYYEDNKESIQKKTTTRRHTLEHHIKEIYRGQVRRSKKRNELVDYTLLELRNFIISDKKIKNMYDEWVDSNFKKELTPSIDRINDYDNYNLNNIQLMTWDENNKKGQSDIKNGINNKKSKAVIQIDKNGTILREFFSIMEASRILKCDDSNIGACCKGKIKTSMGFIWKYKNDEKIQEISI